MKYRMETPIDENTPPECLTDHGRIVDAPTTHGSLVRQCRCRAVAVEPYVPEKFSAQWKLLMKLLAVMRVDDMRVMRRGWHMEDDYRTLAGRLLGMDDTGIPSPLTLPSMDAGWEPPHQYPGDLNAETDVALCAEVCRRVPGMTPSFWDSLDEKQRIGWLRNALTEYSDEK